MACVLRIQFRVESSVRSRREQNCVAGVVPSILSLLPQGLQVRSGGNGGYPHLTEGKTEAQLFQGSIDLILCPAFAACLCPRKALLDSRRERERGLQNLPSLSLPQSPGLLPPVLEGQRMFTLGAGRMPLEVSSLIRRREAPKPGPHPGPQLSD